MRFSNFFQTRFLALTLAAFFALNLAFSKASVAQNENEPKTGLFGEPVSDAAAEDDSKVSDGEDAGDDAMIAERTANYLRQLKQNGLRELDEFKVENDSQKTITFHIDITKSAQAIVTQKKFDIRDDDFSLEDFTQDLVVLLKDSTQYFQKIVPDSGITELHFVLFDFGEKRNAETAAAKRNSNIIVADIRRWHKLYRGRYSYIAYISYIHELTHIANYHLDSKETKYHLELTAIVFELMNYYRTEGKNANTETYIRTTTFPLNDNPVEVLSPEYTSYAALRYIGAFLFAKVLDGTYRTQGKPNEVLEKFGRAYLSSKETGDAGFDAACLAIDLKQKNGIPVTLQILRSDLYAALLPEKKAAR